MFYYITTTEEEIALGIGEEMKLISLRYYGRIL
jgi:hypothetical protein